MSARILFVIAVFFWIPPLFGQRYEAKIEKDRLTLGGQIREGFNTSFDFSVGEVEKGWWRYSREFGRPLNMKSYYMVSIPSTLNSGNVELKLLSRVSATKTGTRFFLALDEQGVPKDKLNDYHKEVKSILERFKKQFYINSYEERLEDLEKKAKKVSKKALKQSKKRPDYLQELERLEKKIDQIRDALFRIANS